MHGGQWRKHVGGVGDVAETGDADFPTRLDAVGAQRGHRTDGHHVVERDD